MAAELNWRWIFSIQLPVMFLCCVISAAAIPSTLGIQNNGKSIWCTIRGFDMAGSVSLSGSVASLVMGLVRIIHAKLFYLVQSSC